jgi:hypothetical protein
MSDEDIRYTLNTEADKINSFFKIQPKFLRLPATAVNNQTILSLAQSMGFVVTTTSIDSGDYNFGSSAFTIKNAINQKLNLVQNGMASFIVLQHDAYSLYKNNKIIEEEVEMFTSRDYDVVRLDVCLGTTPYRGTDNSASGTNPSNPSGKQNSNYVSTHSDANRPTFFGLF